MKRRPWQKDREQYLAEYNFVRGGAGLPPNRGLKLVPPLPKREPGRAKAATPPQSR